MFSRGGISSGICKYNWVSCTIHVPQDFLCILPSIAQCLENAKAAHTPRLQESKERVNEKKGTEKRKAYCFVSL